MEELYLGPLFYAYEMQRARLNDLCRVVPHNDNAIGSCLHDLIVLADNFAAGNRIVFLTSLYRFIFDSRLLLQSSWLPTIELMIVSRIITIGEVENGNVQAVVDPQWLAYAHERHAYISAGFGLQSSEEIKAHRRRAMQLRDPSSYRRQQYIQKVMHIVAIHVARKILGRK